MKNSPAEPLAVLGEPEEVLLVRPGSHAAKVGAEANLEKMIHTFAYLLFKANSYIKSPRLSDTPHPPTP